MNGVVQATKILNDLEARRDGAVLTTEAIANERRLIAYLASMGDADANDRLQALKQQEAGVTAEMKRWNSRSRLREKNCATLNKLKRRKSRKRTEKRRSNEQPLSGSAQPNSMKQPRGLFWSSTCSNGKPPPWDWRACIPIWFALEVAVRF
jgi:hypothetical protein